jgi:hypothetical protein
VGRRCVLRIGLRHGELSGDGLGVSRGRLVVGGEGGGKREEEVVFSLVEGVFLLLFLSLSS